MGDMTIMQMIDLLGVGAFKLVLYAFGAAHFAVIVRCLLSGTDKGSPPEP